ncbi:DUF3566 domain-containing protein [Modestobacter sp. Leaf380]|uniref:DUF3566 domain-containing protein n=1 Tax=Modestobacter sp. Leaf380 TaxID=1736356 RepID=UPI0006FB24D2|nr:DUF3566 domain-containing protein [Modestobacter sp. Leaf380]KQS66863.1 hypothetical protein ASG41_10675 [Modestobacter sp. Leaf380]
MSDRTQGSVRADSREQAPSAPQTQAMPVGGSTKAEGKPAATPEAAAPAKPGKPAAAPGWGGATPARPTTGTASAAGASAPAARAAAPATSQTPAARAPREAPAQQRPAAASAPTRGAASTAPPRTPAGEPARSGQARTGAATPATGGPAGPSGPGGPGRPTGGNGGSGGSDESGSGRVRGAGKDKGRGPRRARLQLRHIDTWSALKISLVLAIALFFVWMVAVGVLYGVLNGLGVFTTLNDLIGQLGSTSGDAEGAGAVITPGIVFGGAAVIGAVNIVLFTALCTVGTFVYNLCSDLVGGLEVTLAERD